jgi:hypothetical protein
MGGCLPLPTTVMGGQDILFQWGVLQWGGQLRGIPPLIFGLQILLSPYPNSAPSTRYHLNSNTLVVSNLEDSSSDPMGKVSPVLVIKDKPSNFGLNKITDNELWIEANKKLMLVYSSLLAAPA